MSLGKIKKLLLDPSGLKSLRNLIEKRFRDLEAAKLIEEPFEIFVYGHTHEAEMPFEPRANKKGWQPKAANTGAWQRVADRRQLDAILTEIGTPGKEADIADVTIGSLPECYSTILVHPYSDGPKPTDGPVALLKYWRKDKDGKWGILGGCPVEVTADSPDADPALEPAVE